MRTLKRILCGPAAALIVAFVALFAAMGGIGYATAKLKPNSVQGEEHQERRGDDRQDRRWRRDDAEARGERGRSARDQRRERANAMNAAKLGGAAPGECQTGWLTASMVVRHSGSTQDHPATLSGSRFQLRQ